MPLARTLDHVASCRDVSSLQLRPLTERRSACASIGPWRRWDRAAPIRLSCIASSVAREHGSRSKILTNVLCQIFSIDTGSCCVPLAGVKFAFTRKQSSQRICCGSGLDMSAEPARHLRGTGSRSLWVAAFLALWTLPQLTRAIVQGIADSGNTYGTVCALVNEEPPGSGAYAVSCSSVLISPSILLSAAHCAGQNQCCSCKARLVRQLLGQQRKIP